MDIDSVTLLELWQIYKFWKREIPSKQHCVRVLDERAESSQPLSTGRPIDDTMVAAQSHVHEVGNGERRVTRLGVGIGNDTAFGSPDSQDTRLGWIDDRSKLFDPEHTQIGDRKRPSLILVGLEFVVSCFRR